MSDSFSNAPTIAPLQPARLPQAVAKPRLRRPGFVDETIRTLLFIIAVTVLFDMGIPRSLVDGRSMQPTFEDTERLIVSRIHYLLFEPHRGEIVVFNSMRASEPNTMLIKRVIGLPNETVSIRNGIVHINGEPLNEDYILEACRLSRCPDQELTLGPNEYYVMGDNRNNSSDSRSFGAVTHDHLVGTVVFRFWPINRIGFIPQHEYSELDGIP